MSIDVERLVNELSIGGRLISSLKVTELKDELKARCLKNSGNKPQLQEMLVKVSSSICSINDPSSLSFCQTGTVHTSSNLPSKSPPLSPSPLSLLPYLLFLLSTLSLPFISLHIIHVYALIIYSNL